MGNVGSNLSLFLVTTEPNEAAADDRGVRVEGSNSDEPFTASQDIHIIISTSRHIYLFFGSIMQDSEVAHIFNEDREPYAPYGMTCQLWKPSLMNRPDYHNEIELNFLERGSLTYLLRGRRVTVSAGRLTAFWALVPHQIVDSEGGAPYYVATIPLASFLQWSLRQEFVNAILRGEVIEGPESMQEGDRYRFRQWLVDAGEGSEVMSDVMLMEVEARLHRLAATYSGAAPSAEETVNLDASRSSDVETMAVFVAANYQQSLHIKDIADSVGLHPDYATSLFQRTFGMTLYDYLLDHRITHAQRLLATTDNKISTIAFDSGFNSISRFNVAFKATCRCTPSTYRQSHSLTLPYAPSSSHSIR
jgi:AraC-like DNA-binding protein